MSKGDNRRPEDTKAFDAGYDQIFGHKKPERGSFVWDDELKKLVPKAEYRAHVDAPMVLGDIQPYQSMQTGEMITSRSSHREHLKQHGLIEVGNEVNYLKESRKKPEPPPGLKQRLIDVVNSRY